MLNKYSLSKGSLQRHPGYRTQFRNWYTRLFWTRSCSDNSSDLCSCSLSQTLSI